MKFLWKKSIKTYFSKIKTKKEIRKNIKTAILVSLSWGEGVVRQQEGEGKVKKRKEKATLIYSPPIL